MVLAPLVLAPALAFAPTPGLAVPTGPCPAPEVWSFVWAPPPILAPGFGPRLADPAALPAALLAFCAAFTEEPVAASFDWAAPLTPLEAALADWLAPAVARVVTAADAPERKRYEWIRDALLDCASEVLLFEVPGSAGRWFHPRCQMRMTRSYQELDDDVKWRLDELYDDYFHRRQEDFWQARGYEKLPVMRSE